jgi:methylated-DNA-[protein]-cysteine S-methyltransferase
MRMHAIATACSIYETGEGFGVVAANEKGLVLHQLPFGAASHAEARELFAREHPGVSGENALTVRGAALLSRYFSGERVAFDLPLDLSGCTPFQKTVYTFVAAIGYGEVMRYGEVAAACGCPQGGRAVGGAMARNRLPILIPCHRVLGAGGVLTGFTAPGGVASKRGLLVMEGGSFNCCGGVKGAGSARL